MVGANPVEGILCFLLTVAWWLLLIRAIVSLILALGRRGGPPSGPLRTAHDLLIDVTEPVLRPLRRIVPPAGMLDLSILVAFVIILVLQIAICG
jgi:YggT family protein